MPIFVENLRMRDCNIAVDVGDAANEGKTGTLKIYVSGTLQHTSEVVLSFPGHTESFEADKDDQNHNVKAKLTAPLEIDNDTKILKFCPPS